MDTYCEAPDFIEVADPLVQFKASNDDKNKAVSRKMKEYLDFDRFLIKHTNFYLEARNTEVEFLEEYWRNKRAPN